MQAYFDWFESLPAAVQYLLGVGAAAVILVLVAFVDGLINGGDE